MKVDAMTDAEKIADMRKTLERIAGGRRAYDAPEAWGCLARCFPGPTVVTMHYAQCSLVLVDGELNTEYRGTGHCDLAKARANRLEVRCPECSHEFVVTCAY